MIEVLDYLRDDDFLTWIISGGGVDFMRPRVDGTYDIPPSQVIGSQIDLAYEEGGIFHRQAGLHANNDKAIKPMGILRQIGRPPVIAFGNSDGDFQMLDYATSGPGRRLGVIIHHTDGGSHGSLRPQSPVGRLDRALDEAERRGWLLVDMRSDWAQVFRSAP
ncbi:hypothetical protein PY32053_04233 (plasmid) [Paracoccus yeei]|uniref:Haloacid dehalogenase-like hydrolase n=1 Tax=Paracoccus yeei TaxID=147645 RepID=A0A386USZ4_9RHOB|nr:hypothetical protein PY32053_04233 [Paracoccus yeei]